VTRVLHFFHNCAYSKLGTCEISVEGEENLSHRTSLLTTHPHYQWIDNSSSQVPVMGQAIYNPSGNLILLVDYPLCEFLTLK